MSDIKIYGEHEPKTLAQMQRCMSVGSAVKGVLCADGHLGYAHPIGGVVAYEEDISISGVGFDIACGNMAVRLRVTPTSRRAPRPFSTISGARSASASASATP
jgi:tRNA-splicing ligase RtcB (3'-phosphate/5'-hydroxy nucleic acid ligase)